MAQITDAELQAWLTQHGGEAGRKDIEDEVDDPTGAVDSHGNARKIKKVDRTEITAQDGATLTLRRLGGSLVSSPDAPQYDEIGRTPPKPVPAGAAADWHTEGTPDGQGGTDNSKPIMVRTVNGKREERQPTAKELEDWNLAGQMTRNPGGKTDAQIKTEQDAADTKARQAKIDADAKAERERVAKHQQEQDARQTKIDEQNAATNAATAQRNAAAEARAAATANRIPNPDVPGGFLERSPDGTWRPIKTEGVPTGALPAGAPRPSGVLGDAAKDMDDFMAWLDPQVRSGAMTQAQADQHVKNRQAYWDTVIKEKEAVLSAQGQSFRDQSAQRRDTLADLSNRRTSATSIANQASGDLMPQIGNFGPGGGGASLAAAIRGSRVNAQDFATLTGANREVAPIQQGAAVQAVNAMPLPGGTAMAPGFDPRGTVAAPAPTGAVVPPAAAAPVAPIFRPPPPVAGSVPPATGAAPVNPPAGQPGNNPNAPVGMLPTTPPGFLAASRAQPQAPYDPTGTIQAMIADPSIDNQMLRAAVAAEYPGYDVDALLASAA